MWVTATQPKLLSPQWLLQHLGPSQGFLCGKYLALAYESLIVSAASGNGRTLKTVGRHRGNGRHGPGTLIVARKEACLFIQKGQQGEITQW